MLEKPKLFLNAKEFWWVMIFLGCLVGIRFLLLYQDYRDFVHKPFYYTDVEVLQQYTKSKEGQTYTVLRLFSPELGLYFFTRTQHQENLRDKQLRLKLFPTERIGFREYVSTSFISSEINDIRNKPLTLKSTLLTTIKEQHSDDMITSFYQGIFLAHPLPKELRESISRLGISHLIALSGFHLAILSGVIFFLLKPLYGFFQQRYFPYRFDVIDIGGMVLSVLGGYVWFVGAPDSLLRSYMMMVVGWLLLISGVELLSFTFLGTIIMLLLVLVPQMLLSLAFWFSVLGVFYIFVVLKYLKTRHAMTTTLVISVGIFMLMLPIIHLFFPVTSLSQLYSPLLSLGFTLFYPLSIGLHLIGLGALFDSQLTALFSLDSTTVDIPLSNRYGMAYVILSLLSIYSRWFFYLLLITSLGFMGWMFMGFML